MKVFIGLGNVGDKYEKTRHNVGFMVLDEYKKINGFPDWSFVEKFKSSMIDTRKGLLLCKPQTMMNSSGEAVSLVMNYYKIDPKDLYVVHDDLDIKLGEFKVQKGKGPKEHKGLLSIYEQLGTEDLWHVRIGIDNRDNDNRISGEDYVLMNFGKDELEILEKVKKQIVDQLTELLP
ncbi:aminoacyl-tRNA hydrolase [Candidatus Woesebacteria bacterium]|nr:aminoacyl-tRNA hydrolase [Candidatus Woesebacteria bacterium]